MYSSDWHSQIEGGSFIPPFTPHGPFFPSETPNFMETIDFSGAESSYSLDYGSMISQSQVVVCFNLLLECRRRLTKRSRVEQQA